MCDYNRNYFIAFFDNFICPRIIKLLKNTIFWDVAPVYPVKWTDVSEERIASIFRVEESASEEPAWAGNSRLSSETSVHFTVSTRRHIQEDGILNSHRCVNLKAYKVGYRTCNSADVYTEIAGSSLCWVIGSSGWGFSWFPSVPLNKCRISTLKWPPVVSFQTLTVHHWLVISDSVTTEV
jgi:hypothetical protein